MYRLWKILLFNTSRPENFGMTLVFARVYAVGYVWNTNEKNVVSDFLRVVLKRLLLRYCLGMQSVKQHYRHSFVYPSIDRHEAPVVDYRLSYVSAFIARQIIAIAGRHRARFQGANTVVCDKTRNLS